jgi:hypothetical protein
MERLADAVRVRGTHSGLALVQMDLDPVCIEAANWGRAVRSEIDQRT